MELRLKEAFPADPFQDSSFREGSMVLESDQEDTIETEILIRYRGHSSLYQEKKQYLIKLVKGNGNENKLDLLGMPAEEEWVLNGSLLDKSMLRNYIAYNLAGEIMAYAPRVRFCTVTLSLEGEEKDLGLYLLTENVKRGENRVPIDKYQSKLPGISYLIRRDHLDESEEQLNTYTVTNHITENPIGIKYPKEWQLDTASLEAIESEIDQIERTLYAEDWAEFQLYEDLIDVDSFVDYFIINEFFMNYDAGLHSTYAYRDRGGKLTMGPVWDFDLAMDNYVIPAELDQFVFPSYPWFEALIRDPAFVDQIISRYHDLRQSVLDSDRVHDYLQGAAAFIEADAQTDRQIWTQSIPSETRTESYQAEVLRLDSLLQQRGNWLDNHIQDLHRFTEAQTSQAPIRNQLALLTVFVFLFSVIVIRQGG